MAFNRKQKLRDNIEAIRKSFPTFRYISSTKKSMAKLKGKYLSLNRAMR